MYRALDDLVADAERLAAAPVRTLGNYSFPQILNHLADSLHGSIDGFPYRSPWWVRRFVAPVLKRRIFRGGLSPGYRIAPDLPDFVPADGPLDDALQRLRRAVDRYCRSTPAAAHPVFGRFPPHEWTAFHLRHAEMHMSFVVPAT